MLLCTARTTKTRKAKKVQQCEREGTPRGCWESVSVCVGWCVWGSIIPPKRISHPKKRSRQALVILLLFRVVLNCLYAVEILWNGSWRIVLRICVFPFLCALWSCLGKSYPIRFYVCRIGGRIVVRDGLLCRSLCICRTGVCIGPRMLCFCYVGICFVLRVSGGSPCTTVRSLLRSISYRRTAVRLFCVCSWSILLWASPHGIQNRI